MAHLMTPVKPHMLRAFRAELQRVEHAVAELELTWNIIHAPTLREPERYAEVKRRLTALTVEVVHVTDMVMAERVQFADTARAVRRQPPFHGRHPLGAGGHAGQ